MKKLIEKWLRAFGALRPRATCAACGVSWPQASRFVEGAAGDRFCRECLLEALRRAEAEVHEFAAKEDPPALEIKVADAPESAFVNPYSAPRTIERPCVLCGRSTEYRDPRSISPRSAACRECLGIAAKLIQKREPK